MKFSFIIPCYNTKAYLSDCLESILQQTYANWEILLINDGSTDHTEEIIRSYAEKDDRIRTFYQENQGVSEARNRGVENATGDYLLFVDSDDWYKDENCLKQIADTLRNKITDIVVFRYQAAKDKKNIYNIEYLSYLKKMAGYTYTGEEYLQTILSENELYPWFPWLYAFKREFWLETQIKFNRNIWILEDMDIIYQIILKARKIEIIDKIVYQYRARVGSATRKMSKKSMQDRLNVCKNNIDTVDRMSINTNLKKLLNSNFSYVFFRILLEVNCLDKNDRQETLILLGENCYLMNYTINKRHIYIKKISNFLGISITAKLLFMHHKWTCFISGKKSVIRW